MKFYFKKLRFALAIAFVQLLFCTCIYAKNNVINIEMDVLIHDDGSATINQMWEGTFDEGTENYITINDRSLNVTNFNVSFNGSNFTYVDNWDINASFDLKANKCGINRTSEGIELCFGISKYGANTYYFSYDVLPLVKSYNDYDGFNFMFLNPGMNIYPSNAKLRIRLENGNLLNEENARIWAFGYDGDIGFHEGQVITYTNSPLYTSNNVIIMLRLDKGIVYPTIDAGVDFESIRERAFEGSDYSEYYSLQNENKGFDIFAMSIFLCIGIAILSIVVRIVLYIRRIYLLNKFYKESNYFRDTPNAGDIALTHTLYEDFDIWNSKETNVIAAIILKMIHDKNLEPQIDKTTGFFGIEKTSTSLKLISEPIDDTARRLYDIIKNAAGADGILQENELKRYAEVNYKALDSFMNSITTSGHNVMNAKNGYKKLLGKNLSDLTDDGKKELSEIYGYRKYLDDFTIINERDIAEVDIWENMLIYATLFGIGKKVLKSLKKVYPDRIVEIDNLSNTVYISDAYFRALYFNSISARQREYTRMMRRAAGGFGGRVSMGGGGGFSGGGFGGGSR